MVLSYPAAGSGQSELNNQKGKKNKNWILQREFRADRPELYFDPIKKKNN